MKRGREEEEEREVKRARPDPPPPPVFTELPLLTEPLAWSYRAGFDIGYRNFPGAVIAHTPYQPGELPPEWMPGMERYLPLSFLAYGAMLISTYQVRRAVSGS